MHRPGAAAACEQARLRFELAEAARRAELGWSQRQLAVRAGMSQPGIVRFEAGGTTPTLPLLERLAAAVGLTLTVTATRRALLCLITLCQEPGRIDPAAGRCAALVDCCPKLVGEGPALSADVSELRGD